LKDKNLEEVFTAEHSHRTLSVTSWCRVYRVFPKLCILNQKQSRNKHWANRANARGLALEYQNTPLLVFHIFMLFTTRQNCRAFYYCVWYKGQGNW